MSIFFIADTVEWINNGGVKQPVTRPSEATAKTLRWARKLADDVATVMARHPDADPEDVRLALISLQLPPLERLNRSLRRGRGFAAFRK